MFLASPGQQQLLPGIDSCHEFTWLPVVPARYSCPYLPLASSNTCQVLPAVLDSSGNLWYQQGTATYSYPPLASNDALQVLTAVLDSPGYLSYQQAITICLYLPLANSDIDSCYGFTSLFIQVLPAVYSCIAAV
jgi:hypothetical protein